MTSTKRTFSDEYKLEVVTTYFMTNMGVRKIAQHFGLPTKNYITRWIKECKDKGLIADGLKKPSSGAMVLANENAENPTIPAPGLPVVRQLESDNLALRAELDFLKKVKELKGVVARQK